MKKRLLPLIALFCLAQSVLVFADSGFEDGSLHAVAPRSGDGITILLNRYELLDKEGMMDSFLSINQLKKTSELHLHKKYKLPVALYRYNGKSIRSTIGDNDWDKASRIKKYNERLLQKRVRSTHYTASRILWVPLNELSKTSTPEQKTPQKEVAQASPKTAPKKAAKSSDLEQLFGKKHSGLNMQSNSLENTVIYVVSGHGGPDPGAVCTTTSSKLCEDEYAYDVSIRLAKELQERGAIVEMVIQDTNDGIRDASILQCDRDERLADGSKIPLDHLTRLKQRTNYINNRFKYWRRQGVREQAVVSLHIDSNSKSHKTDVFFCYYKGSNSSKSLASTMMNKFEEKYNYHQKNRGYHGYLSQRGFYVLRKTSPPAVLIELANIQNKYNHKRILQSANRQALAKWIAEGLEEEYGTKLLAQN